MAESNAEIVIRVEDVYKDFLLPQEKISSVKGLFTSLARGKGTRTKSTQHALKGISFDIKQGEFFGIVGRNGSGKSTLLKILAGIYQPTKGKVYTQGKLVPFIELGVGFNPELTGRQNVFLNGAMLGFSESEVAAMYDDIVDFAELKRFMDQKLKNYSSGMQVRLAFSMATRAKADILLIDEVLAVGDADFQRKCFNYFSQLKNEKITVVFISHDMSAVREYCDRAMLIDNNEIVTIGRTDDVAQSYLRMFVETKGDPRQSEGNTQRWGDNAIRIQKVSAAATNKEITIIASVKAVKDFAHPIAGLRIRDAGGHEITGTSTKNEHLTLPDLVKGETLKVTWKLLNVLRDGEYMIDVAMQYPDDITVADWWNEAAILSIKKDKHSPYTIDPGFEIIVKKAA